MRLWRYCGSEGAPPPAPPPFFDRCSHQNDRPACGCLYRQTTANTAQPPLTPSLPPSPVSLLADFSSLVFLYGNMNNLWRNGKARSREREREKTDRVVLIGKSKEDVKIWSKEVSLRWLKGNLVQRQMSLSLSFSLPVPPLSIFNRGYRVSGSPLPSLIYTHNCEEEHGPGKGSSPTLLDCREGGSRLYPSQQLLKAKSKHKLQNM